jgi:hypothetical protein
MNVKVVKHEADEEKDQFKVVLKGKGELVPGSLIEMELRLKGKTEEILEHFPRGFTYNISLSAQPQSNTP